MKYYSNISLLATPTDNTHVITVGYGAATFAAKVHTHAISDVTGLTEELATFSVTTHQHTVEPVDAVPASGIITLERDKTQYKKTITGNTVIGFDTTSLGLAAGDAATFELLVQTGNQAYQVLFGSPIAWLNGEEPLFNTPNTSYLCAFRTYDGGASWVGSYEGQF